MEKYFSNCGLYCGACPYMVATETGTTAELAERFSKHEEEVVCTGCKSHGHDDCEFHTCEKSKDIETCAECDSCPCDKVLSMSKDEWEHHSEVIGNLNRIKVIGRAAWLMEQYEKWKCRKCGERTEWYQKTCKKCGEQL